MKKYIALLRGINVSGKNKIKMQDLKLLLESIGFDEVQTYIQSGNILFKSIESELTNIEKQIEEVILNKFNLDIKAIAITKERLEAIVSNNPFLHEKAEINKLAVCFLKEKPDENIKEKIPAKDYLPEEYRISSKYIYLNCPNGFGRAKLNNNLIEKKLKVSATTRNWKTVTKLWNMVD